jgi:hypothetical protein
VFGTGTPKPTPQPGTGEGTPTPTPTPSPGEGEGVGTPTPTPTPEEAEGENTPAGGEDLRQVNEFGQTFISDGTGLALYEGSEYAEISPEYTEFGTVAAIEEDGIHIVALGEDGKRRRKRAEDLDLTVSIEVEIEE